MPIETGQNKFVCSQNIKFATFIVLRASYGRGFTAWWAWHFNVQMKTQKSEAPVPTNSAHAASLKLKAISRAMKREKLDRVTANDDGTYTVHGKLAEGISVIADYYKITENEAANRIIIECLSMYKKEHGLNIALPA